MNASRRVSILVPLFVFYFLAVALISFLPDIYRSLSVNPDQGIEKRLEEFSEDQSVKNGLSALLSVVVTVLVRKLAKNEEDQPLEDEVEPAPAEQSAQPRRRPINQEAYLRLLLKRFKSLQGDHEGTLSELKRTGRELYSVKRFARRKLTVATLFVVAASFAVSHLVSAGVQAAVRSALSIDDLSEPLRFIVLFAQSLTLTACAFALAFFLYRRYYRLVRRSDFKSMFLIGWCGVFAAGAFAFLQLRPEIIVLIARDEDVVPYFQMSLFTYLLITKLLVFPVVGLCGAAPAGAMKAPQIS